MRAREQGRDDGRDQGRGEEDQVRAPFTEATAVINVSQIKDHSICGYTGCLKNITHGAIINPHDFHEHNASPQIAELYAQDVVKSRVRLHITDGFKLIYDEGPLDTNKKRRVPHEAVYATTDPVAMDVIGWGVVEQLAQGQRPADAEGRGARAVLHRSPRPISGSACSTRTGS
jgi:uncharacterized protein (DUF362 family)